MIKNVFLAHSAPFIVQIREFSNKLRGFPQGNICSSSSSRRRKLPGFGKVNNVPKFIGLFYQSIVMAITTLNVFFSLSILLLQTSCIQFNNGPGVHNPFQPAGTLAPLPYVNPGLVYGGRGWMELAIGADPSVLTNKHLDKYLPVAFLFPQMQS